MNKETAMTEGIVLMQQTKSIKDIDVSNQRVLIRVDFNVPLDTDFNINSLPKCPLVLGQAKGRDFI